MSLAWYWYHLDTSAYDEAVGKVKKYNKLLKNVKEHVENAQSYRTTISESMTNANQTFMHHNAGTTGHVLTFYNSKAMQWKNERSNYWGNLKEELAEAEKRLVTIQNLITEWEGKRDSAAQSLDNQVAAIQEEERKRREREHG